MARLDAGQSVSGLVTLTDTTAATVLAAPAAGKQLAVTSVLVVNGHATIATKVEIRDGSTVKLQGYAEAAGGGFSHRSSGQAPLFIAAAATAVTARCVTTGADVDVFVSGVTINAGGPLG